MVERTGFMIGLLDSLVERGFPRNSFIVVSGPVGVGKSYVLRRATIARVRAGERVIVTTLDNDPVDLVEDVDLPGRLLERITVLNGFGRGAEPPTGMRVIELDSLNPESLLSRFEQLLKTTGASMLSIDSLNEIILALDPALAISFIKSIKRLTRRYNALVMTTLHTGVPGFEQIESLTYYLADGVVTMDFDPRFEQIGLPLRRLRILKLRSTRHEIGWVPFQITGRGLEPVDVKALIESIKKASEELQAK